ncbi:hypothetical protein [Pyxidicoccus xibeiensis]|uniref:hypothetical protein n=1 Tax=Pyxidicoccus xibeiensis TaxID=2906759 RepID=UPI0020A776A0|nr:hypothetical protein [Pyxidicoccus xibeiensis]MCP3140933.1 hypothetical protein [Pyxidicoccus xibeiensis]
MDDIVYGHLERAAESFARHDEEETLGALLAAWRVCRSPALVKVCEEVERRLVANGLSADGNARPPPHEAWEYTPRSMAWLLVSQAKRSSTSAAHYLDQLLRMSPNPQFGPALLLLSRLPEFQAPLNLTKLCLALKHVGPPFDVAPLEALHARLAPDNDSAGRLAFIIRMGREWVPPALDARAEAALQDLSKALGEREEHERRCASVREQWLPLVYAQLDDDAARLVMADELVALGDPWGEFIVLQCSPASDEARVNVLLEAHRSSWEEPLGLLVVPGKTRFERGFPVAVQLGRRTSMRPSFPAPSPSWSTVREIDWGGGEGPGFHGEWFMHPHLRGIRRMRRMEFHEAHFMGPHPSVSRLELRAPQVGGVYPVREPGVERSETFEKLALLPSLSWLELRDAEPEDLRICASSSLARKLERFDADRQGAWRLTARPAAEVPIEATLVSEEAVGLFVEVLRAAEGFGTRGVRVRCERKLKPWEMQDLKQATAAYAHVEWA